MKVGIMSMQLVKNYGSFLQAYGLKKTLESLGHEVSFVDYFVEPPIVTAVGKRNVLKQGWNFLCHRNTKTKRAMYRKAKKFDRNIEQYHPLLGIKESKQYRSHVDCLVIGSDEVFNCLQASDEVGYSKELFGANHNAKKLISYAASFGSTTLKGLKEYHIADEIATMLSRFDHISVRDQNSYQIVHELVKREPAYHVDPVLIYDFEAEVEKCTPKYEKDSYIAVYSYRGRFSKQEGKAIRKFAKEKKLRLLSLGGVLDFCDDYIMESPFDVMRYVKDAAYVITDTFHGTVFSIKYAKKFVTVIRESNRNKLLDLLGHFSLSGRALQDINQISKVIENKIDDVALAKQKSEDREKTIQYLKTVLQ